MRENVLNNDNYLVFGNYNIYKCQTLSPDGTLNVNISASTKETKDEYDNVHPELKDSISVKLKLLFNGNDNSYNNFSFNFNDINYILRLIKNNQEYIKNALNEGNQLDEPCYVLKTTLTYTSLHIYFYSTNGNISVSLLISDLFDSTKNNNIFLYYFHFKELLESFNYFVNNYININNMFINKYYNHCIYNTLYNNLKTNRILFDMVKDHDDHFLNTLNDFKNLILSIFFKNENNNIVHKTNDNRKLIIEKENNLNNTYNNIDDLIPDNNENNINNFYNDDINETYNNVNVFFQEKEITVNDEYSIQDEKIENYIDDNENDNYNENDNDNDNDNEEDNTEYGLYNQFDDYIEKNDPLLKKKTNDIMNTNMFNDDYQIKNEELKEKYETLLNQKNFVFKNIIPNIDIIRNRINGFFLKDNNDDISYLNSLNNFVFEKNISEYANYLFEKCIQNKDIVESFIKIVKYYNIISIEKGHIANNDTIYPCDINTDSLNQEEKSDIDKLISFLFVCLIHFNDTKKILVENNIDEKYGIKDERKTVTNIKLTYGTIIFGYILNKNFNKDKFLENCINVVETEFFNYDYYNKKLNIYESFKEFEERHSYEYYKNILNNIIKLNISIKNNFQDYKSFIENVSVSVYKLDKNLLDEILNIKNQKELNEKFNNLNLTSMNNIVQNIIDTKDFSNIKLVTLISKIQNDYTDLKNFSEFNEIDWLSLNEKTLKSIIAYKPKFDERLKKDVNYFKSVVDSLNYSKKECIDLILGNVIEQNITNKINFDIF